MEVLGISKTRAGKGTIKLRIADTRKSYPYSYVTDGTIFGVQFPEELNRILRVLPPRVMQNLIKKIEHFTAEESSLHARELELEKHALQLV